MLMTILCFGLIIGTHIILGPKITANSWSLWKTLALVLTVITLSVPVSILLHSLLPTILLSVVMATVLQQKFMSQPRSNF